MAGVMVSIVAFQAVDPGSIPGLRRQQHRVTPPCSFGCTGLHGGRECPRWVEIGGASRYLSVCLLSLVVEHSLCKRKVGGSIPPVGFCFLLVFLRARLTKKKGRVTTSQRFELWRAEPNRFLIYLLNHSDTMSLLAIPAEANWRRGLAR